MLIIFSTNVLADCQEYLNFKKLKTSKIDERLVLSMLNDYKNIYHVEKNQIDFDKRLTYKFDNYFAIQFSKKDKTKIIIVFDDKTQLISVIENKKILFCGDNKK